MLFTPDYLLQKEKEGLLEEEVDQHHHHKYQTTFTMAEVEVVDQWIWFSRIQNRFTPGNTFVIVEEDINYGTKKKKRKSKKFGRPKNTRPPARRKRTY